MPTGTQDRQVRMMTTARHHLCKADAITVVRIEAAAPFLAIARHLTERFAEMVRQGRAEHLAG